MRCSLYNHPRQSRRKFYIDLGLVKSGGRTVVGSGLGSRESGPNDIYICPRGTKTGPVGCQIRDGTSVSVRHFYNSVSDSENTR